MELSKITNSKTFKIAAIIALPTILVASFYGYKFVKKKIEEKKLEKAKTLAELEREKMQEKYKNINSIDEFLEGVKYLKSTDIFGYDLLLLKNKRNELEKMGMDNLKKLYEVSMKSPKWSQAEMEEFLNLIHLIYPN